MKLLIVALLIFLGAAELSKWNADSDLALISDLVAWAALLFICYKIFFQSASWLYQKFFVSSPAEDIAGRHESANLRTVSRIPDQKNSNTDGLPSVKIDVGNQFKEKQEMDYLVPEHNLLILSVNKSVTSGAEIYNAARYAWKIDVNRALQTEYVLAHQSGRVVGVFEVEEWLPANDKEFESFESADPSRWGFIGRVAQSEILMKYFNKQLPEGFLKRGAANPVRFIFMDDPSNDDAESGFSVLPSSDLNTLIKVRSSSGRIDSDGDFSGSLELDIASIGEQEAVLYMEGEIVAEINGRIDDMSVYETAKVSDGSVEIRSSYIKLPADSDVAYTLSARLDVFKFNQPKVFEVCLPATDDELPILYEQNGVKVSRAVVTFGEEGDCRISLFTSGRAPYGFSSGISGPWDEPYASPTISYDVDNQFDEVLFDVSPGEKIKVAIAIGQALASKATFEAAGLADVDEREEDSDHDCEQSFGSDADDPRNVFIACINNHDYRLMLDDEGVESTRDLLLLHVISFMDAIMEHVDDDALFFLCGQDGKPRAAYSRDEIADVWDLTTDNGLKAAFEPNGLSYFKVIMVVKGGNHWENGFVNASGNEDVPPFHLWGLSNNSDEYAVQCYSMGSLEGEGIDSYAGKDDYSEPEMMGRYGVSEHEFLPETYGVK